MTYEPLKAWAFAWKKKRPFITPIVGWTRRAVIDKAEELLGQKWKAIYRDGGRAVKVIVQEAK